MPFKIERSEFDPEDGFLYYVSFKPHLQISNDEIKTRMPVEAAISVSETGELADLAFTLPESCCNRQSLQYLNRSYAASVVEDRVFVTVPGMNGDSVLQGKGTLELDGAGRIMGIEIN